MDELYSLQDIQEFLLSNDSADVAEEIRASAIEWLKKGKAKQIGLAIRTLFMGLSEETFEQFKAL